MTASNAEAKPRQLPKPASQSFSSSFESFLQANKTPETKGTGTGSGGHNRVARLSSGGRAGTNGNAETADNLNDSGPVAQTPDVNKWGQSCENCAALVHLMYNHLIEISEGRHHPIQDGTPQDEIVGHLAVALGYNERQVHRMIKMGENPYRCRHCTTAFATRVELNQHVHDEHQDIATLPCPNCDKWYKTQESLEAHHRNVHKPPPVKDYMCPVSSCTAGYSNYGTLKRHVQVKHPEIPIPSDENPKRARPATRGGRGRGRGRGRGGRGRGGSARRRSSSEEESETQDESDEYYQSSNQDESDESIDFQEDRF